MSSTDLINAVRLVRELERAQSGGAPSAEAAALEIHDQTVKA
jgi:hypothetical protein